MILHNVVSTAGRLLRRALAALCAAGACAVMAEPPHTAVEYLERPEDGPLSKSGRRLTTDGQARYGVDINSAIDIKIDAAKLQAGLAGQDPNTARRVSQLNSRVQLLSNAVQKLEGAARELHSLLQAWRPGDAEFERRQGESSKQRADILTALVTARRQRLAESGAAPGPDPALNETVKSGLVDGYNWTAISNLFNIEIEAARKDLAAELALGIEVQAHLLSKSGSQGTPIYLPGYNEAPSGAATPHEKLQFGTEGQAEAYKRYEQMAREIESAKNVGEAVLKQLELELQYVRAQLDVLTQGAQQARDQLRDRLQNLEKWSEVDQRRAWLTKVEQDLRAAPQGKAVLDAWGSIEASLTELKEDIAALRAYADLRGQLAGKPAPEAMDVLLRVFQAGGAPQKAALRLLDMKIWDERLTRVEAFVKAVDALQAPLKQRLTGPDGPYGDLKAAHEAFKAFVAAVRQSADAVALWLGKFFRTGPAYAAANLPLPPGHRRMPVLTDSQLGTRIDLQRIPVRREVGDTVRVKYEFFKGETKTAGGWTDEFSVRSYGWNSEVLASLAFTRQGGGATTWKPTAAMNWILWREKWPEAGEDGLARSRLKWLSGAGISVMPLDSENNEGVRLGLGLTVAFLNNRLLVGAGQNLQATSDKQFVFFSIRVLDFPGLSGPVGGTGGTK